MRILDRFVAREFLRLFALFAIGAPLLFVLGDLTDNLDTFTERQIPGLHIVLSYIYQFPLFVLWSFPIASLIATVFTVSSMSRHSELTAAKAGGISFWRALAVLPVLGILLTAVGLFLSELVPVTLAERRELMDSSRSDREVYYDSRTDFVFRAESGYVWSIRRLEAGPGRMFNVAVEREGDGEEVPTVHIVAPRADWDPAQGWILSDGWHRTFPPEGGERLYRFASLIPGFYEPPDALLDEQKDPEEMRYAELARFIDNLRRSGGEPLKLEVELAQKIALPVATLIIILFGAPLANSTSRGGPAFGIGVSLGVTILYLMLFRISGAFGGAGMLPPLAAAWIPNGLFLLAGFVLIVRVRT